ncbi:MAG: 2-oxo acid dehydrogenase subunit E2 [Chloroflexi bacterium]|nr:2-oxo acid dehydrogenase subunit E2 [Chloroflexota bacterium]
MASTVVMPQQGNSVETCIIYRWRKNIGEPVAKGEILLDIETDKAVLEIESSAAGILLEIYYQAGDEVPVKTPIALIGQAGEQPAAPPVSAADALMASPRARKRAAQNGVNLSTRIGSGAQGRIIERDVLAATLPRLTPAARALIESGMPIPPNGTGLGGRITSEDVLAASAGETIAPPPAVEPEPQALTPLLTTTDHATVIPLRGVRKVTAERMLASLQTTAQLTLTASADARALQAYRARLKASAASLELSDIGLNDLILFAVARTLRTFPDLNATLSEDAITQSANVNLGFAVDSPRGLLVPVIHGADRLSLHALARESKRLIESAGKLTSNDLNGGTFTVTNLGSFGIETFTPILNPPQVAILGVGKIDLKPMQMDAEVQFIPYLHLSLTIDHRAVDGAPAARFLQALSRNFAQFDLLLAF